MTETREECIDEARKTLISFIERQDRTADYIELVKCEWKSFVEERYIWDVVLDAPFEGFGSEDTRYIIKSRRPYALEAEVEGAYAFTALSEPGQGYRVISERRFFVCEYIDGLSAKLFNRELNGFLSPDNRLDQEILDDFMSAYGSAAAKYLILGNAEFGKDDILVTDESSPGYVVSVDFTHCLDQNPDLDSRMKTVSSKLSTAARSAERNGIDGEAFKSSVKSYVNSLIDTFKEFQERYRADPESLTNLFENDSDLRFADRSVKGWISSMSLLDKDHTNIEETVHRYSDL